MKKAKVLRLYKKVGETPLECLNHFRKSHPSYKDEKMTYAGRLDPLAEGVLLVLVGEECRNKEKYLKFDKEYELDILFGFETDSYDLLGLVNKSKNPINYISPYFKKYVGRFIQKYPPYSSKFWAKARSGKLLDSEILEKKVEIYNIKLLKTKNISKKALFNYIKKSVGKVTGDFRQKQILAKWKKVLDKNEVKKFPVISIKVRCSSGTYMRSLAHNIGNEVRVPTLALRIKRTLIYK